MFFERGPLPASREQLVTQNLPMFGLHGASMFGRTPSQARHDLLIEIADD
jgi:hypothetical protein